MNELLVLYVSKKTEGFLWKCMIGGFPPKRNCDKKWVRMRAKSDESPMTVYLNSVCKLRQIKSWAVTI